MNLLAALSNPDASVQFGRRTFLSSAAMAGIGAVAGPAAAETTMADVRKAHPNFKWDDPVTTNRVLTRMYGSLEPGKIAYLYFFGRGVGTTGPDDYTPLFRMISIAASISIPQPNGAIRYKAGQIILFTDWNTGEVLERWKNPYTEEMCDVFHYRDYPLDYTLDPNKMAERYTDPTDLSSRKLIMPWTFLKGKAYGDAFVKTKNKNKLDPAVWKRESIGEYWTTFEHYQWQADIAEIADERIPQIKSFNGDFQTFKPFEPWMLMGQRPGKVFQQKTAMNLDNFDPIPRNVMAFVEKNMSQFLDLSNIPENSFKLNDQHYAEERKPMP